MLQLTQFTPNAPDPILRQMFTEYLQWFHENYHKEYGITFDLDPVLSTWMLHLSDYYPPFGRMYIARYESKVVGIGGLKQNAEGMGEIKKMFVRPEHRGKGFGGAILDQLIADARAIGYSQVLLDSPKLSTAAHKLYQSRGFQLIAPYPGSEGAAIQPEWWVYMQLVL